ncbi:MAG: SPOR domain-containing protein [Alcanivoracaceae bacterium]|nr:SPOR domain-containing protein [Alcanivoracaceae bacterium]
MKSASIAPRIDAGYPFAKPQPFLLYLCASLLLAVACSVPVTALAAMTAAGVQYPAWKVDGDTRVALAAGDTVVPGDHVVTGKGGKVWLQMEDEALVKLGEEADFALKRLSVATTDGPASSNKAPATAGAARSPDTVGKDQQASTLEGALSVLKGAFRYTSDNTVGGWNRNIEISMASVATIGIRGTDLWGAVNVSDAFVVLLEGVIDVQGTESGDTVRLDTPLQLFQSQATALTTVSMDKVQALAPQTELDFGTGVMKPAGPYVIHLASYREQAAADRVASDLSTDGLAARVVAATVAGTQWFRVTVSGLASLEDARALQRKTASTFNLDSPWVAPR